MCGGGGGGGGMGAVDERYEALQGAGGGGGGCQVFRKKALRNTWMAPTRL